MHANALLDRLNATDAGMNMLARQTGPWVRSGSRPRVHGVLFGVLLGFGTAAWAADLPPLPLPTGATVTEEITRTESRYAMPVGPWDGATGLPTVVIEGTVTTRVWRLRGGLRPQQILRPVREALTDAGWRIVLDCAAAECGGFDFRFATRVTPAPAMFVDILSFRFLSARAADGSGATLLASGDAEASYLQLIHAKPMDLAPSEDAPQTLPLPAPATEPVTAQAITERLEAEGHVVLPDLVFETGSATLVPGAVASLDRLAQYLRNNPDRRLLLVGHTDAVGSLEANQALSERRAAAALAYLRDTHSLPEDQIGAAGVGFLAPLASNLTQAGRQANRRVDAVLLPRE